MQKSLGYEDDVLELSLELPTDIPPKSRVRVCKVCQRRLSSYNTRGRCLWHPTVVQKKLLALEDQTRKKVLVESSPSSNKVEILVRIVTAKCEITWEDLIRHNRSSNFVWKRQLLMYLLYTDALPSLPAIGKLLGGRDHTTILHGVRKVRSLLCNDAEIRALINSIRSQY
jgi:chromosomal replication initiator protein